MILKLKIKKQIKLFPQTSKRSVKHFKKDINPQLKGDHRYLILHVAKQMDKWPLTWQIPGIWNLSQQQVETRSNLCFRKPGVVVPGAFQRGSEERAENRRVGWKSERQLEARFSLPFPFCINRWAGSLPPTWAGNEKCAFGGVSLRSSGMGKTQTQLGAGTEPSTEHWFC